MAGTSVFNRPDLVLIPFSDVAPIPIGLVWCRAHESARVRAIAEVARSLCAGSRSGMSQQPYLASTRDRAS